MREHYHEIMEHICVGEETKSRILHQIDKEIQQPAYDPVSRRGFRSWLGLAACFAILITGSLVWLRNQPTELPEASPPPVTAVRPQTPVGSGSMPSSNPGVMAVPDRIEADSVEALEQLVGFPVETIPDAWDLLCTAYGSGSESKPMAEIKGRFRHGTFILRKSGEVRDNSGDYSVYPSVLTLELPPLTGELRGDESGYQLAVWTDGTCSWSLRLSERAEPTVWNDLIRSIMDS